MKCKQLTPLGALRNGVLAGMVGTVAMDLLWYRRYKRDGGEDGLLDWEFSAGTESYEQVGAPAQVGKRLGWGTLHGLAVASASEEPRARYGLGTGAGAWAASYAMLAPAKLYRPMREYPPSVLGKDLSAHLFYGLATGAAFRLLTGRERG